MIRFGVKDACAGSGGMRRGGGSSCREVLKGWRDKRGAIGLALVVGCVEEFRPRCAAARQPLSQKHKYIQDTERHRSLYM